RRQPGVHIAVSAKPGKAGRIVALEELADNHGSQLLQGLGKPRIKAPREVLSVRRTNFVTAKLDNTDFAAAYRVHLLSTIQPRAVALDVSRHIHAGHDPRIRDWLPWSGH